MYKRTRKKAKKDRICARMRAGKIAAQERRARELGPRPAPFEPPKLRRVVIVIDFDLGFKLDIFRLFRTNRIDSYQIEHNHAIVGGRIGWANFCKRLSAHFPRVLSPYSEH